MTPRISLLEGWAGFAAIHRLWPGTFERECQRAAFYAGAYAALAAGRAAKEVLGPVEGEAVVTQLTEEVESFINATEEGAERDS